MINEWTMNNTTLDSVRCNDLKLVAPAMFVQESILPIPLYSVKINGGYLTAPPDVYFDGSPFTVTVWVFVYSVKHWSRVLEFCNGIYIDTVLFALSFETTGCPVFQTIINYNFMNFNSRTLSNLTLNVWTHLTLVQTESLVTRIYVNGTLANLREPSNQFRPEKVIRTINYIGKSIWPNE